MAWLVKITTDDVCIDNVAVSAPAPHATRPIMADNNVMTTDTVGRQWRAVWRGLLTALDLHSNSITLLLPVSDVEVVV